MIAIWIWGGFGFLECADWWCVVGWGGVLRGPTHVPVCFRPPSWRPSYFSLLAQREVTKRKAPSRPRSFGHRAQTTPRGRSGGSLTGHPWPDSERARIVRAPLRAFSCATSPGREGPVGAKARPSWPQKPRQSTALCFALDSGSLCGAAKGGRNRPACAARG